MSYPSSSITSLFIRNCPCSCIPNTRCWRRCRQICRMLVDHSRSQHGVAPFIKVSSILMTGYTVEISGYVEECAKYVCSRSQHGVAPLIKAIDLGMEISGPSHAAADAGGVSSCRGLCGAACPWLLASGSGAGTMRGGKKSPHLAAGSATTATSSGSATASGSYAEHGASAPKLDMARHARGLPLPVPRTSEIWAYASKFRHLQERDRTDYLSTLCKAQKSE